MKKVLAILFAMIFVVSTTGLCFAQAAPAKAPEKKEAAPAPEKKADDKAKAPEKKAEPKKDAKKTDKKKADKKKADKRIRTRRRRLPRPTRRSLLPLLHPKRSKHTRYSTSRQAYRRGIVDTMSLG